MLGKQAQLVRVPTGEVVLEGFVLELDRVLDSLDFAGQETQFAELALVVDLGRFEQGQEFVLFSVQKLGRLRRRSFRADLAGVDFHDTSHSLQLPNLVHSQFQFFDLVPQLLDFLGLFGFVKKVRKGVEFAKKFVPRIRTCLVQFYL